MMKTRKKDIIVNFQNSLGKNIKDKFSNLILFLNIFFEKTGKFVEWFQIPHLLTTRIEEDQRQKIILEYVNNAICTPVLTQWVCDLTIKLILEPNIANSLIQTKDIDHIVALLQQIALVVEKKCYFII